MVVLERRQLCWQRGSQQGKHPNERYINILLLGSTNLHNPGRTHFNGDWPGVASSRSSKLPVAVITPIWGHRRWSHRSRLWPTTTPRSTMTDSTTCLGRTCLKWGPDGELAALDLSLVLKRLAQVDQELTAMNQHTAHPQPCPSLS
jgi:hypothetical protein